MITILGSTPESSLGDDADVQLEIVSTSSPRERNLALRVRRNGKTERVYLLWHSGRVNRHVAEDLEAVLKGVKP